MSVLSTSKKAAAVGSGGAGGCSTSAAAADASPASAAWLLRPDRPRLRLRPSFGLPPGSLSGDKPVALRRPSSCLMCIEPTQGGPPRAVPAVGHASAHVGVVLA